MKYLERVLVDVQPAPKREYIDVALDAVALQCKENDLSKNEMLDPVDDIQQMVNRVCRDKRSREDISRNTPLPPPAAAGFAPQQQDPNWGMGLALGYEPQYYNM